MPGTLTPPTLPVNRAEGGAAPVPEAPLRSVYPSRNAATIFGGFGRQDTVAGGRTNSRDAEVAAGTASKRLEGARPAAESRFLSVSQQIGAILRPVYWLSIASSYPSSLNQQVECEAALME